MDALIQPPRLAAALASGVMSDLVDRFFPANAVPLGRMVDGKRAASSLYALAETLKRRRDGMDSAMPAAAAQAADPDGDEGDPRAVLAGLFG